MSATALKLLRDTIKRRSFEGAYYIVGDDEYQKEDAVRQLIDAAIEPSARDFNLDVRKASDLDSESLSTLVATLPMFSERRVVVIRDVAGLRKESRKILDAQLVQSVPDLLLILTTPAGGKVDASISSRATTLNFEALAGDRVPKWVVHHAKTELGLSITEAAVELLQGAVGNDLFHLSNELDKLASFIEGRKQEIGEEDVAAIVGVRRGETQADLLDAVADRNVNRALELAPHILAQPKTSAVSVVMTMTTQMLAIAWGRARLAEGVTRSRLQQEYFDLLRETAAFTGRSWGSAASIWTRATEKWDAAALRRSLDVLLDTDVALKESRVSSDEQLLANAILSICATVDRHAAA